MYINCVYGVMYMYMDCVYGCYLHIYW